MFAQQDTVSYSLEEIIDYSLQNQPVFRQMKLQEDIADAQVRSDMSGWFPQAGVFADYFRYFEQPVAIFPDFNNPESGQFQEVRTGVPFNSNVNFFVEQSLFNNELFLAKGQAELRRKEAAYQVEEFKQDLILEVGRAFYETLLSQEQIRINKEDLVRQERQLKDARLLYEAGITDNIDYKRATITLQNTQAALFEAQQDYKAMLAVLQERSGVTQPIRLVYDEEKMVLSSSLDTLETVEVGRRPDYQLLLTQQDLQGEQVSYFRRRFIPTLSAFFNYNIIYQTPFGNEIFNRAYPNSLAGLRLNFPIFQGGRRNHDIRAANLEFEQLQYAEDGLLLQINREHEEALSGYKSRFYEFRILESNKQLAEEIYNTVSLQYEEGIKNFLEVIQAETDLRTARINYYNALFRMMTSRLEVLRARGTIDVNIYD
ncbi:TolC family protein [Litoribacter ruber]|uniref:TolC family protein n=1 Tax=Litoribacter ruber TaxID=702568 RepID=UPI001BDA8097|nr:TolC family protein [Litoribacter ruber]MBT0810061.1 TolC family protein [Litoribacter ruber]